MRAFYLLLGSGMTCCAFGAPGAPAELGSWKPAGSISVGRYAPAAALLPDGRAILAGGYSFESNRTHSTSDAFDPASATWSEGPKMRFDRNFPETLALPGGDLLLVAGFRAPSGTTATTERLDTRRFRFAATAQDGAPPTIEERELFSVCRLPDGRFLLTGGYSTLRNKTLATAEIYDHQTRSFRALSGTLKHARFGHTSVLLPDGRVLVVGGKVLATEERILEAELFDPKRGTFTPTGSLQTGRDRCTAWLLPADQGAARVLVAGGSAAAGGTAPARACEIYTVSTGKFSAGPELIRDRMAHTATTLADGKVLLAGGWSSSENATTRQTELWDPKLFAFKPAGLMAHGRHDHAAILIGERVLCAGGKEAPAVDQVESPLAAEIWAPNP